MQLSSKILRGVEIKGWRTYYPPLQESSITSDGKAAFPLPEELAAANATTVSPPVPSREEIEQERQSILQFARQESESQRQQLLTKAQEEAVRLREEAWQEGYRQGHLEGEKAAEKVKDEARSVLEDAYMLKERILTGAEPEIIRLAVNLAEKLLNYQLSVDDNLIIALIARCLESLPGGEEVVLRVSPYDEAACRERAEFIRSMLKKGADLEILVDADIAPGCCKVETEESEVTFLLNRELQILAGKLLELAGSGVQAVTDDSMAEEMFADEYMADEGMMDEGAADEEFVSGDGADETEWDEAAGEGDGMWDEAAADEGMTEEMAADEAFEDEFVTDEEADEDVWDEAVEDENAAYTA